VGSMLPAESGTCAGPGGRSKTGHIELGNIGSNHELIIISDHCPSS